MAHVPQELEVLSLPGEAQQGRPSDRGTMAEETQGKARADPRLHAAVAGLGREAQA